MTLTRLIFLLLSLTLLNGCFSPLKTQQPNAYLINTIPSVDVRHTRSATIFVTQPDTRAIYNTTAMAYTTCPYQVNHFGENQWAETPSQMFLPLIVQTLQNSRAFKAIVLAPYTGRYDYILSTQIIKIQQNFMTNPARFELSIRAQLININNNRVMAIKQFNFSQPMPSRSPMGGVIAANQAAAQFLRSLTQFCVANT
jgi:cholesterol transport system auxiliary component